MRVMSLSPLAAVATFGIIAGACGNEVTRAGSESTSASSATGTGGQTTTVTSTTSAQGGGSTTGPGGAGGTGNVPSDVYPAPHPPPPKLINVGGQVLSSPKIVPIVFASDDATMASQIQDFVKQVGGTKYWAATTTEYGVGAATSLPGITVSDVPNANTTDDEIQAWLKDKLANDPQFPAPDGNTIYSIFYPAGVVITQSFGGQSATSCVQFGGYHSDFLFNNNYIPYAVVPRCADFDGFHGIDAVTAAASHEFLEASTDPFPMDFPAYGQLDIQHIFWEFALGAENGDLCAASIQSFHQFPELPYLVQRTWSNISAQASHDPCVPTLGDAYFNTAPELNDSVTLDFGGGQKVKVKGVKIPVGSTKTIDLDLFSDAPTPGPWFVQVIDGAQAQGQAPELSFSTDMDSGLNGQKIKLDITALKKSQFNAEIFYIVSQLGQTQQIWVGIVGN